MIIAANKYSFKVYKLNNVYIKDSENHIRDIGNDLLFIEEILYEF